MLSVAVLDANERASREYAGITSSVVSGWLEWEMAQAGIAPASVANADLVLLAFAGALDWAGECRRELRRAGVQPEAAQRGQRPYIIAGGPVDATPLTALAVADALTVGEAYTFVRTLLALVVGGATLGDVQAWIVAYPHAIERSQVSSLMRDAARPWLLAEAAPVLATPDAHVDWGTPPVRSSDRVVRVIAEKGCHCKCTFCATTYRQTHRQNPNEGAVLGALRSLERQGERVQLVSNDPMNLPYFRRINTRLDSQSFTVMEVSDAANRRAIIRSGVGIARFGVEGVSERIRKAFAKPIAHDHLLEILADLHAHKINTHMFFIVGAPGESAQDWAEFRIFYERLTRTIRAGICRIKFTTFVNTPPAPLARYVPDLTYEREMESIRRWIAGNAASRHIVYVRGRGGDSHIANVGEQLSVSQEVARRLTATPGAYDLAPTLDDARRLPWEIVGWPIDTATRWRMGSTYARRMGIAAR